MRNNFLWRGRSHPTARPRRNSWDLTALINGADHRAPRPYRHLWLVRLAEWIRGAHLRRDNLISTDSGAGTSWPARRIRHLLNVLDRNPVQREKVSMLLRISLGQVDSHGLWADFGFAPRGAFLSELSSRLRRIFLPSTPDTTDLGVLFRLIFADPLDAQWIAALDEPTLQRIADLLRNTTNKSLIVWRETIADAIHLLASQISASGFSALMRQRMDVAADNDRPFHRILTTAAKFDLAIKNGDDAQLATEIAALRALLEQCRRYATTIYGHLNEHGISVDIIFEIHQLCERSYRIEALLATLTPSHELQPISLLMSDLIRTDHERKGIRALFAHHYSMLAHKLAQRSGIIGEHYITSTRNDYFVMLGKASKGGAVLAVTTFLKFLVSGLGVSLFWTGLLAGVNYAASFLFIYLLHGVVATKQPAMTAAALAAKLEHITDDRDAQQHFVIEVAKLIRSQFAGIAGNLLAVIPVVLGIQLLAWKMSGAPVISTDKAMHILADNTLLGPTLIFAAITGVILFAGSLLAGWIENWFIWHRLDSAIAWNPRFIAVLGDSRAKRWSKWWRKNISGVASNISLGLMLGLVPISAQFFGLPLEVRHVTLVTGQVAAALGTLGVSAFYLPQFWWSVAAVPLIALCNLGVSFTLAFRLALRSRGIQVTDRKRIANAILYQMRHDPLCFLYPARPKDRNLKTD